MKTITTIAQNLKWVAKVEEGTVGREEYKTWDIYANNGSDVFTIDKTEKGFFYMDFGIERHIGNTEEEAIKYLDMLMQDEALMK